MPPSKVEKKEKRVRLFYRVDEVARLLGVTDQTIRNWIREEKIRAQRFGRPHLIPLEEVARLTDKTPDEVAQLVESLDKSRALPLAYRQARPRGRAETLHIS